jgi:hypothetical protein
MRWMLSEDSPSLISRMLLVVENDFVLLAKGETAGERVGSGFHDTKRAVFSGARLTLLQRYPPLRVVHFHSHSSSV